MGDLFFGGEDILSDRGEIEWNWEKREVEGKQVWIKVCRLIIK